MISSTHANNSFESWCRKTNHDDFLECWDSELNGNISPATIAKGSHKKYHWICKNCGTRYLRAPHSFTENGKNGCPECWVVYRGIARHNTAVQKHNLKFNYPELAQEWMKERNDNIDSSEVAYTDSSQYWWRCSICGTEWKAAITNRIKGTGCPRCRVVYHSSFPERAIFYYVSKYFPDAVSNDRRFGFELDVFIPSEKTGIEYDGQQWHQDKKKDEEKNRKCRENGIVLFRIRERKCWFWSEDSFLHLIPASTQDDSELNNAISVLLLHLNIAFADIDVQRDRNQILGTYLNAKRNNSLAVKYPELAKEFDLCKNAPLTPDRVDFGSGIMCSWICSKCGYPFFATPNARTNKGTGCPSCAHTVAWKGHTDLFTTNPELKDEWDYERNALIGLIPEQILAGSEKQAYWKCQKGHSWKAAIVNRKNGHGCPFCAREKRFVRVINRDTGTVFQSIKEASAHYGIASGNITEVCSGKRKTAGGYHWSYYRDGMEIGSNG